jgi:EAL domain-containing protein (putative c-di-GMP-specific phosphodiesterase class I)
MTKNEASQKIVKGMVRMAHSLQLKVIAEGAEGSAEVDMLTRMKCDMVQGFAYGRPMPINHFVKFARLHAGQTRMSALTL